MNALLPEHSITRRVIATSGCVKQLERERGAFYLKKKKKKRMSSPVAEREYVRERVGNNVYSIKKNRDIVTFVSFLEKNNLLHVHSPL